jgi:hypothetical protein
MRARHVRFSDRRTLIVCSLDEVATLQGLGSRFATLLPAYDEKERQKAEATIGELLGLGCVEFCCVGPEAEQLHDAIDGFVEDRQRFDVVTTAHDHELDACEYFVLAAAGKPDVLLGLVAAHPPVVASLERVLTTVLYE